ncbi:hypothetical protein PU560_07490 [Georgenia sp. 10Sc9-8]|uniref:DNA polymerase Y-family little finger domain-containing protein n=1 Tax=Georgenia halotolerans TaxID=3028317 RepID=A0ABT5TW78_9MICO|nr:hypothetical protein [Georgenia halotolerans]
MERHDGGADCSAEQTLGKKLPAPTRSTDEVLAAVAALAERLDPGREVRLLGVRAEMAMPEGGDPAQRTPVRGRL